MLVLAPDQAGPLLAPLASEALATIFVSFFLHSTKTQVGDIRVLHRAH